MAKTKSGRRAGRRDGRPAGGAAAADLLENCLGTMASFDAYGDRVAAAAPFRAELLRDDVAAGVLVGRAWQAADDLEDDGLAADLLQILLEEARLMLELQQMVAACRRFLLAAEHELAARIRKQAPSAGVRHAFGRVYLHAGLPVPDVLRNAPPGSDVTGLVAPQETLAALEGELDLLREAAEEEPAAFREDLAELLAPLPAALQKAILERLFSQRNAALQRLALYWLLDTDAGLRDIAAEAVLGHAREGGLDPALPHLLTLIADWLPPGHAQAAVAEALGFAASAGPDGGRKPKKSRDLRVYACMPDGAGAQSFAATVRHGRRRIVAMVLLKAEAGVRDAYVIPCASAGEQQRIVRALRQETDALAVRPDCLERALSAALTTGLTRGFPPAPGLLDVAEACGLKSLRPRPISAADWLAALRGEPGLPGAAAGNAEELIRDSDGWVHSYRLTGSWFEMLPDTGDEDLPSSLAQAEDEIRQRLEARRPFWALQMLRAADILRSTTERQDPPDGWAGFAAVAEALLAGCPLGDIPAMEAILDASLLAHAERWGLFPDDAGDGDTIEIEWEEPDDAGDGGTIEIEWEEPPEPGELEAYLAHFVPCRTAPFLDGLIAALLTAPRRLPAMEMMELLLGSEVAEITSVGEQRIGRLLGLLVLRLEEVDARLAGASSAESDLHRLIPAGQGGDGAGHGLAAWAAGFLSLADRKAAGWGKRRMRPDDRKCLATARRWAEGRPPEPGEPRILAQWLAQRRNQQE